ncbi:MAG: hypothetical protein L0G87_00430 [Renibacterium salmoninarum]|nr:hypothetical protein [Renibacterium salmoninarum]
MKTYRHTQSKSSLSVLIDWQVSASRLTAAPPAWKQYPVLVAVAPSGWTEDHWRQLSVTDRDLALHAFWSLARSGDELAAKTIMARYLYFVSYRVSSATCLKQLGGRESHGLVISAMWQALTQRNPPRLPSKSIGTLILNTLNALTLMNKKIAGIDDSLSLDTTPSNQPAMEEQASWNNYAAHPSSDRSPQEEVSELLAWALDTKTLKPLEVQMLTRVHLNGEPGRSVCQDFALSEQHFSSIINAARRKLQKAVQAHISTWGTW